MNATEWIKRNWYLIALALIVFIALWYRMGIIDSFVIPTYGNTMYHVGIERETIITGHYPDYELSYGGGFPHFYVPAYRLLITSMAIATGIDPMVMSGLITIMLGLFILLAMFAVAYRLTDNIYAGLFAAFFFILSPEMTIFTIRPLPEILGLFMVPFTIYFLIRKDWGMATVGAIITALTHQMTLLTLVGVIAAYGALKIAYALYKKQDYKEGLMVMVPAFAACATYGLWQVYSLGTLNILNIAQVVNREGNPVDLPLFLRTGVFVLPFFLIGIYYIFTHTGDRKARGYSKQSGAKMPEISQPEEGRYGIKISLDSKLLVLAWVVVTLLLTKNEVFGMRIFMDRFFTFYVQIAIIVAGVGLYALLSWIELRAIKVKPE